MGKKARGRKGGVAAAENAHNQQRRASRAAAAAAVFSNTDRSTEPYPGFTAFSSRISGLIRDLAPGRDPDPHAIEQQDEVLHLGPGEKNFAGADRMCTPCRRCSEAYNGGGIICDVCGVTWWCSAHCRALDGDGHKATCHHVKLLGFQVKRDGMRALPFVEEAGSIGCMFDFPREVVTRDDVGSAAANGDVAAIDRLLAQHGAAAANATTAEHPVPPIVCAALQGHATAVTRLLRAGADPNAESHLGCTAAYGAAQNGHVAVIAALAGSGADFDKPDAGGVTPLGIAIEHALPAVVDALLTAGADPDLRSGRNACPPLALAATQAAEKTISTTRPGSMIRAGTPCMDGLGFDTSGLALSESDEPRVRTLGAGNSNALTFLIDMPLVDYVSKQAEITALLLAAPGLRAVDGVPAFVPLVDFATAGAMNRVAAAPALVATRALIAAGADPNAARRADRSRDDDKHTIVQGGAGDKGVRGLLQSKFGGFLAPSDVERRDRSDDMSASLTPLLALCHYRRRADTPRLEHYRALLDAGADPDRGVGAVRLSPLLGAVVRDDAAVASALLAAGADASGTHDLVLFRCDRFIYFDPEDGAKGGGLALTLDQARARRTLSTLEFAEVHRPRSEVTRLLRAAAGVGGGRDRGELAAMGVKALKAELVARGLSTEGCFEKKDLVDRLAAAPAPAPAALAAADAAADFRLMAMQLPSHPREAARAVRMLHRALAQRAPGATAAARELVASCYLPGAPSMYDATDNLGNEPRVGTAARTLWSTALLSRCAFQLERHINDSASASGPLLGGFEHNAQGRVTIMWPRGYQVAGDSFELLSNAAMDEPRSLYAALLEDSYQGLLQLVASVITTRFQDINGWEEQPELVGATTFRSRSWMSGVMRPADYMKTMYRRWSAVGADEIVSVLEALVREGHSTLARRWLEFVVRSVVLMAPLEDIHLLDAARSWDFAIKVCERARASPVLMAEEDVKTLSLFKLSFVRVLRTRAVEAYARICGETPAAKAELARSGASSDATLRRRAAEMRAELQRLGRRTDFLDRAAFHAEAIRESTVEVLESGQAFEGADLLLGNGVRLIRAIPGPGNREVAYLLVPFAVSSFCLAFRARRAGDPAAAARYFCEAMFHFPEDDVRKPAAAWFLADSRSQAPNPMRLGELRDVVAMAEEHEAAFAASDLGDRLASDDLACRARLKALVAATADRAADDILDVDAYTAPAVGPAAAADARPACANCGKTRRWDKVDKPLSKCARCKSVAYCGAACQKAHWKAHKAACRAASAS